MTEESKPVECAACGKPAAEDRNLDGHPLCYDCSRILIISTTNPENILRLLIRVRKLEAQQAALEAFLSSWVKWSHLQDSTTSLESFVEELVTALKGT